MKITVSQLKKIISEEVKKSLSKSVLKEGHSRITAEEINAWKSGNWGFVSESTSDYAKAAKIVTDDSTVCAMELQDTHGLNLTDADLMKLRPRCGMDCEDGCPYKD